MSSKSPHVLVVEDQEDIRFIIAEELVEAGFAVSEAHQADEAQALLQSGLRVDIVFSDIMTPGQITGVALARWISRVHPGLPIILTSGYTAWLEADPSLLVIEKPYLIARVIIAIRNALGIEERLAAHTGTH